MLNVEMYTQMGYTKAQVVRAHEYSLKNKMDMFDALQLLQSRGKAESDSLLQKGVPRYSYMVNLKGVKIN